MAKRKAMSSEKARNVRYQGHRDALLFAKAIGVGEDYQNNAIAKKDVVDHNKDKHSVKSGGKRWQVFLYGRNRFLSDNAFQSMNGIGQLLIECLDAYPETYDEYQRNKNNIKEQLRNPMRRLCELFQEQTKSIGFII